MRFAIVACSLKVAALVALAAPLPTPAAAEFRIAIPYTQWRDAPRVYRPQRHRPSAGDTVRPLLYPVQCAGASHLCGWKRIPRDGAFEGFETFQAR